MLDETIITETPPLYSCYGRIGEQVCVPITGNRPKRILHGALNIGSGEVLLLITEEWGQETHQAFLTMLRSHWRGWHIVVFEDRGSPHTAEASRELANRPTQSIDASADSACQYLLAMSRQERLRKAGVLSGNFWLTK
jgi:hypothetical protein